MRTILDRKQQAEWISANYRYTRLQHAWSTRGNGRSRILDSRGERVASAGGCGYDRRGAAMGAAIARLFPQELATLARRAHRKGRDGLYGLFWHAHSNRAGIDGGCGFSCMEDVLTMIGFRLVRAGGTSSRSNTGSEFFILQPVDPEQVRRVSDRIRSQLERNA